jgi:hypothetical protein
LRPRRSRLQPAAGHHCQFRPAYERHLQSLHFVPGFDLDAELSQARLATARDDSGAHLENKE